MKRWKLFRDKHPFPHLMNSEGGCCCTCEKCVRYFNGRYYCVCNRCSEDCPAIGRLGNFREVEIERKTCPPDKGSRPARRWYRE